jgi:hypothetical protein
MGIDSRNVTPELTRAVVHLAAEVRSFERVEIATEKVLGRRIPRSTIRRLAKQVGQELSEWEELDARSDGQHVVLPAVAVVSCDGGRIRTREAGSGRGVRLSGENGWRETKNSSFERMCPHEKHVPNEDPCAALPTSFRTAKKVANIAGKPAPSVAESGAEKRDRVTYDGPRRVLRTALSSMASSDEFGPMMQREAKRRRFYEAALRAFLGDGLNWNWTIWKKYFPTFVPILDFIHAIQYIFCAAMAMVSQETEGWVTYVRMMTLCWQGQVDAVIEELRNACHDQGIDPEQKMGDDDPRKPLVDAVRYLTNNRTRMDYPRYRRMGLPVTSAPMESLIKQINLRVKGTEMFWDDPDGAEAILHLRAAVLSEDGRLDNYLSKRPGWPFHRRTTNFAVAV